MSNNATLRHSSLISCDINDDGFIDIPIGFLSQGASGAISSGTNELIKWITFDAKNNPQVFTAWYSVTDGYYLTFSNEWINNISITYDDSLGMAMFNRYDKETNSTAGEFLRIRKIEASEWNNSPPEKYIKVAERENSVWIARLSNPQSPLHIDRDTLLQRFRLIEPTDPFVVVK